MKFWEYVGMIQRRVDSIWECLGLKLGFGLWLVPCRRMGKAKAKSEKKSRPMYLLLTGNDTVPISI